MNEWMNEESWMRGQQTYPLTIHFNMWTVSSDVNIQRRHWPPLSVHLWAYCTHPTHDVNDVMSEGWPQNLWCMLMWFIHENILIYILKRLNSLQIRQNIQNSSIALKHKPQKSPIAQEQSPQIFSSPVQNNTHPTTSSTHLTTGTAYLSCLSTLFSMDLVFLNLITFLPNTHLDIASPWFSNNLLSSSTVKPAWTVTCFSSWLI